MSLYQITCPNCSQVFQEPTIGDASAAFVAHTRLTHPTEVDKILSTTLISIALSLVKPII
jgi:hypothetical protein